MPTFYNMGNDEQGWPTYINGDVVESIILKSAQYVGDTTNVEIQLDNGRVYQLTLTTQPIYAAAYLATLVDVGNTVYQRHTYINPNLVNDIQEQTIHNEARTVIHFQSGREVIVNNLLALVIKNFTHEA